MKKMRVFAHPPGNAHFQPSTTLDRQLGGRWPPLLVDGTGTGGWPTWIQHLTEKPEKGSWGGHIPNRRWQISDMTDSRWNNLHPEILRALCIHNNTVLQKKVGTTKSPPPPIRHEIVPLSS